MADAVGSSIDRATFDSTFEAVGGDPEFVAELVGAFAADVPLQVAAMRSGLDGGDPSVLVRGAHTLKSASASLGALALAEACGTVEAQARSGDLAAAAAGVERIESMAVSAVDELKALVPQA